MATRFEYPAELRFACTRCGDCCRGWFVMLAPGEADALAQLAWHEKAEPDLTGIKPWVEVGRPRRSRRGRIALRRREDGACIYLGEANQCRIHEHFGAEAKPLMCRLYPFGFYPLEDFITVDVSFACRAVAEERGDRLEARVAEWSRLLQDGPAASSQHRFSPKYRISGRLLWELEHHLLELLEEARLPLLDRIRTVQEFLRLALTSDPRTEPARMLRQTMAKAVAGVVRSKPPEDSWDETQRAVFHQILFLSLNPTPMSLTPLSDGGRLTGKPRKAALDRRLEAAERYRRPDAHPWVNNREIDASFEAIEAVGNGYLTTADGEKLMARYLEAKILGQRFMRAGDEEVHFLEAVPRLLVSYPLWLWTAKALTRASPAQGKDEVQLEVQEAAAREALRLLDRSLGELRLDLLPSKQRKAWLFVLRETDLASVAGASLLRAAEEG